MKLGSLYGFSKSRWQHRGIYRSALDMGKAFYLRATTPDRALPQKPGPVAGVRLHLNELPDPVFLRTGNSDFLVFAEIFENGEYRDISQWNIADHATVVDLGGNIGLASLYFGSTLKKSRIVVVEPDADNCDVIRRNCEGLIRAGRLQIVQAFAAGEDGSAGIDRSTRSWAFKMTADTSASPTERIRCISIPSLLRESGFEKIDLLKCDIEGAEAALFEGCRDWIAAVSHLIVETHAPYQNVELYKQLRDAGWEFDVLKELQEEKVGLCFLKRRAQQG